MSRLSVLVVGSGGREHALAWALARSPSVTQGYVAPGNAGTGWLESAGRAPSANVAIAAEDIPALLGFACDRRVDLAVIGPEAPLAAGIADAFQAAGVPVFGPTQAAARLESSKAFAKAFMRRHALPTAEYGVFGDFNSARAFVRGFGRPVVVKADGLAAGKGVVVCDDADQAEAALSQIMRERAFGAAGDQVVVEERLSGSELSALAFSDGASIALMPFARDHKRIFDGDQGANTGGMGAYAPVPGLPADLTDSIRRILTQTVRAMADEGTPYRGVLYAGLMLLPTGQVKLLEFNCRFGDPETQAILPLLDGDLAAVLLACTEGSLSDYVPRWHAGACATVVAASPGYPGSYPKGLPISGLDAPADEALVFQAGTVRRGDQVVTAGGRVLAVSARGESLAAALASAYARLERIHFEGMHYRRDIGRIRERMTP